MSAAMTLAPHPADEFLSHGESEARLQLIEGAIVDMNTPGKRHQDVTLEIAMALRVWCREGAGRGYASIELDHRLDERNVFAPDVWWVAAGAEPHGDVTFRVGPPDLAVEVRSASTWRFDVGAKLKVYERVGLAELWLVDTASESVLVYRRSAPEALEFDIALEVGRGESLTGPQLPGFALPIESLFRSG